MPDNFGISFMPTDSAQQGQGAPPLQEAIKLLNLRLPRVLGAQAPVNSALLNAPGLQGGSDMAFLRQLLGQFMPSTPRRPGIVDDPFATQFPPVGQKNTPRIVPKEDTLPPGGQAPQPPAGDGPPRAGGIEFPFPYAAQRPPMAPPSGRDDPYRI